MLNKRILLIFTIIVSSTILLTVITASLIEVFSKTEVHASDSVVYSQQEQKRNFPFPDPSKQDSLSDSVKVATDGEKVLLRASVTEGSQIYECQASASDPNSFAWKLQAPFALLRADNGTDVIHSTDPTWLFTKDGSEVKGKVGQYTKPDGTIVPDTATPDANSLPWLRVDVTEHRGNSGLFSNVDEIQRLYTSGGIAPTASCDRTAANDHVIMTVAYSAEYVFWGH